MPSESSTIERLRETRAGRLGVLAAIVAIVGAGVWLALPASSDAAKEADARSDVSAVEASAQAQGPAPTVGQTAPDLVGTSLDGSPVSLADHRGRPVWVVFNATWCAACRAETPDIVAAHQSGKIDVISVYMGEDSPTVDAYAQRLKLPYVSIPDADSQLSSNWRVSAIPAHFFIDSDGVVQQTRLGAISHADAEAIISQLR